MRPERLRHNQSITVPAATRTGQSWWPEEDAMVMDPDTTDCDTALALHRTFLAVRCRRRKLEARAAEATSPEVTA